MKVAVGPLAAVLAMSVLSGGHADAQVRARGSVRVATPRARASIVVGAYRRPYYAPFYFDGLHGPYYYRPFYWYPQAAYGPAVYDGAALRMQVSPRETEVYIDNYYAGTVDDFDGFFQRLHVSPGSHDITLYLDGYRTVRQRIYLQPTGTFRLRYTMQPLGPGEAPEPRPAEPPPPQPQAASPRLPRTGPGPFPPVPPRGGVPPQREPPLQNGQSDAGTLALRVQPASAEIFIDGERWEGPTADDRLVVDVTPGRHHIEVRTDGYRTYQSDVDVRPGETTTLNVSLSRQQ